MRNPGLCLILLLALVWPRPSARAEGPLSLATLEWAPYVGKHLPNKGFTTEIVTAVLERAGYRVDITFMPWARVLRRVARGEADAMYPAYYSKERDRIYALSDPFAQSFLVFYKRAEDDIAYTSLRALQGYRIGVVRGYVNAPAFDEAAFLRKEAADSDESNLRKLLKGRIDLAVIDRHTARHLIATRIPEAAGRLVPLAPPLQIKPLYLGVSRRISRHDAIVEDFNRSLSEARSDGTLNAIQRKHGVGQP